MLDVTNSKQTVLISQTTGCERKGFRLDQHCLLQQPVCKDLVISKSLEKLMDCTQHEEK